MKAPIPTDNRILGTGITREFSYNGDTGCATFYMGDHAIDLTISFIIAQQLAADLKRRYLEGYRAGLEAARCAVERMEEFQV